VEQVKHVSNEDRARLLGFERLLQDALVDEKLYLVQVGDGVLQPVSEALVDD